MSEQQQTHAHQYLKSAYLFISLILFAPILLWPIPILLFQNPMLADAILPKWHLSMMIMLIACIAMDSILYGIKSFQQAMNATLWVIIPSILIVQNPQYTWLLAMIFLMHSFRSGRQIFMHNSKESWWLNIAYSRDLAVAITLFIWLIYLPT